MNKQHPLAAIAELRRSGAITSDDSATLLLMFARGLLTDLHVGNPPAKPRAEKLLTNNNNRVAGLFPPLDGRD